MLKVHNFSAGPCILPNEVFHKSAESILNRKSPLGLLVKCLFVWIYQILFGNQSRRFFYPLD